MENRFELIEKYLMNEMSVREQLEFEELLMNDPELMSEFKLRKEINNAIIEKDVIDLRENMNIIISENNSFLLRFKNPIIYSSVAAVAVLLIIVASMNLSPFKVRGTADIFSEYYSPYPSVSSFRSSSEKTEIEDLFIKAFNSYDKENYEIASDYFEKIIIIDNKNITSKFYLSICEIEEEEYLKAKDQLKEVLIIEDHIFYTQVNWYLALVTLKLGQIKESQIILEKIILENIHHKKEAEEILKNLK